MPTKLPPAKSVGEETLALQLRVEGIPFHREGKLVPGRNFRFDFVIGIEKPFAVEVEGGIWTGGAHTRGKHFESDCVKYAEAFVAGFPVIRFSVEQVTKGYAIDAIKRALK
jgi:hypothetical protein